MATKVRQILTLVSVLVVLYIVGVLINKTIFNSSVKEEFATTKWVSLNYFPTNITTTLTQVAGAHATMICNGDDANTFFIASSSGIRRFTLVGSNITNEIMVAGGGSPNATATTFPEWGTAGATVVNPKNFSFSSFNPVAIAYDKTNKRLFMAYAGDQLILLAFDCTDIANPKGWRIGVAGKGWTTGICVDSSGVVYASMGGGAGTNLQNVQSVVYKFILTSTSYEQYLIMGDGSGANPGNYNVFNASMGTNGTLSVTTTQSSTQSQTPIRVRANPSTTVMTIQGAAQWDGNTSFTQTGLRICKFHWTPRQIVVDSFGNLYTSNQLDNRIVKLTYNSDGSYSPTVIAGNGTGLYTVSRVDNTDAKLGVINSPFGLVITSTNTLYVSDGWSYIRKLTPTSNTAANTSYSLQTLNSIQGTNQDPTGYTLGNRYGFTATDDNTFYIMNGNGTLQGIATPVNCDAVIAPGTCIASSLGGCGPGTQTDGWTIRTQPNFVGQACPSPVSFSCSKPVEGDSCTVSGFTDATITCPGTTTLSLETNTCLVLFNRRSDIPLTAYQMSNASSVGQIDNIPLTGITKTPSDNNFLLNKYYIKVPKVGNVAPVIQNSVGSIVNTGSSTVTFTVKNNGIISGTSINTTEAAIFFSNQKDMLKFAAANWTLVNTFGFNSKVPTTNSSTVFTPSAFTANSTIGLWYIKITEKARLPNPIPSTTPGFSGLMTYSTQNGQLNGVSLEKGSTCVVSRPCGYTFVNTNAQVNFSSQLGWTLEDAQMQCDGNSSCLGVALGSSTTGYYTVTALSGGSESRQISQKNEGCYTCQVQYAPASDCVGSLACGPCTITTNATSAVAGPRAPSTQTCNPASYTQTSQSINRVTGSCTNPSPSTYATCGSSFQANNSALQGNLGQTYTILEFNTPQETLQFMQFTVGSIDLFYYNTGTTPIILPWTTANQPLLPQKYYVVANTNSLSTTLRTAATANGYSIKYSGTQPSAGTTTGITGLQRFKANCITRTSCGYGTEPIQGTAGTNDTFAGWTLAQAQQQCDQDQTCKGVYLKDDSTGYFMIKDSTGSTIGTGSLSVYKQNDGCYACGSGPANIGDCVSPSPSPKCGPGTRTVTFNETRNGPWATGCPLAPSYNRTESCPNPVYGPGADPSCTAAGTNTDGVLCGSRWGAYNYENAPATGLGTSPSVYRTYKEAQRAVEELMVASRSTGYRPTYIINPRPEGYVIRQVKYNTDGSSITVAQDPSNVDTLGLFPGWSCYINPITEIPTTCVANNGICGPGTRTINYACPTTGPRQLPCPASLPNQACPAPACPDLTGAAFRQTDVVTPYGSTGAYKAQCTP